MSWETSEKLRRIFNKYHILVHFKPTNKLRQKLIHPEDKTPKHEQSNVVNAVQCSQAFTDLYIGETEQPLHKQMVQHKRASSSGQDSLVHYHLKEKNLSFEDNNVNTLAREDKWCERGVRNSIFVLTTPKLRACL